MSQLHTCQNPNEASCCHCTKSEQHFLQARSPWRIGHTHAGRRPRRALCHIASGSCSTWLGVERNTQNMKVITGDVIYYLYSFHSSSETNPSQVSGDKCLVSIFNKGKKWKTTHNKVEETNTQDRGRGRLTILYHIFVHVWNYDISLRLVLHNLLFSAFQSKSVE